MRVDDGGAPYTPPTPPPPPPKPAAPAVAATAVATPPAPGTGEGAQSTAQWPGGVDSIDTRGVTGPELRMLNEENQQDYSSGTFNDGSYPQSSQDRQIATGVTSAFSQKIAQGNVPTQNDTYYLNQYVAGKMPGQDATDAPQRLQNTLAALGPQASAAWLQNMSGSDYKNLGIQNSFNTLVSSGKLTDADARALVDGDAEKNTGYDADFRPSTVASLVSGLPNDPNSSSFKVAYAHQALNQAEQLTNGLNSGQYSGESNGFAKSERSALYSQARTALDATTGQDSAKRAAFTQMTGDASALAKSDSGLADRINAYASDVLGDASPDAVSSQLRGMGGIDDRGNVDPNSATGQFLASSLRGEASFGTDILGDNMLTVPSGTSRLLGTLAQGSDPKLTQGVLQNVLQNFESNPDQAQALQSQDALFGTNLQKSLASALDSSFDQFITSNPATNGKADLNPDQALHLTVLSAIENGPPFEKGAAANFESIMQNKAQQYADFAAGKSDSQTSAKILAQFNGDKDAKQGAVDISSAIVQSYISGANGEQGALVAQAAGVTTPDKLGDVLSKVQDSTALFAAIPGDVPGDGLAAAASTVAGVVSILKSNGIIPTDTTSGAKKAEAQLAAGNDQSGANAAGSSMDAAFHNIYNELYSLNNGISLKSALTTGGDQITLGSDENTLQNFLANDQAPIHQDY